MRNISFLILFFSLAVVLNHGITTAQQKSILDFEKESIGDNKPTHKAQVSLVKDSPNEKGKYSAKTTVDGEAGSKNYFGTGFSISKTDLTKFGEIRFWIKADFESQFGFSISSGSRKASVFRFSNTGSRNKWIEVVAPLDQFTIPTWARTEAALNSIQFIQVTAFGNPPYDGKTIWLDQVSAFGRPRSQPKRVTNSKAISLTKVDGRHWLVDAKGNPFFAHGVTHVNNGHAKLDLAKFSIACKRLGFNAYGYGCPPQLRSDMPYLESWNHLVPISMYRGDGTHKFVDIFDRKEQARIERGVKANCELSKNNPNCIGYCWTDLGTWPLKNSAKKNWVQFMRKLPESAPGRQAYQKFIDSYKGKESRRDQEFLKRIAREYFRVIGTANRKYDPDHLIFGDRLSFYTYDEDVLREMLPWIDAIAFQPHFWGPFPKKEFEAMYKLARKPILLCDFAIRFDDGNKDIRSWKKESDSVAAAKAYSEYVTAALNSEYIIGVFWCNPVDTPKNFGKGGVKQGFFADGLASRPGLHEAVKKLNQKRVQLTPENKR